MNTTDEIIKKAKWELERHSRGRVWSSGLGESMQAVIDELKRLKTLQEAGDALPVDLFNEEYEKMGGL